MPEEAPSKRKALVKLLLLGTAGALVLVVLVGGGWFTYRKVMASRAARAAAEAAAGSSSASVQEKTEDEEAEESTSGEGEGGASAGPPILVYKNNVNLEGKKNAYLVVELHILFRDAELGKQATSDKPTAENSMIRAVILDLLSGKSLEEVSDTETRELIRQEIKEKLNEKFAPKPGQKTDKKHKRPQHPVKEVLVVSWAIAQ